jgi:hypothetical protein
MEIKTVGEFADLVERMRTAQKEYFRTRHPLSRKEAMELEVEVDACIKARHERLVREQQSKLGV